MLAQWRPSSCWNGPLPQEQGRRGRPVQHTSRGAARAIAARLSITRESSLAVELADYRQPLLDWLQDCCAVLHRALPSTSTPARLAALQTIVLASLPVVHRLYTMANGIIGYGAVFETVYVTDFTRRTLNWVRAALAAFGILRFEPFPGSEAGPQRPGAYRASPGWALLTSSEWASAPCEQLFAPAESLSQRLDLSHLLGGADRASGDPHDDETRTQFLGSTPTDSTRSETCTESRFSPVDLGIEQTSGLASPGQGRRACTDGSDSD